LRPEEWERQDFDAWDSWKSTLCWCGSVPHQRNDERIHTARWAAYRDFSRSNCFRDRTLHTPENLRFSGDSFTGNPRVLLFGT